MKYRRKFPYYCTKIKLINSKMFWVTNCSLNNKNLYFFSLFAEHLVKHGCNCSNKNCVPKKNNERMAIEIIMREQFIQKFEIVQQGNV